MTNKKAKQAGRPTNKNQNLSKQLVLQTALPLMTESGVEAVSFRKLAAALDATPMAVKYHVGCKQELLKSLVEIAFKGIADERAGDTTPGQAAQCPRTVLRQSTEKRQSYPLHPG